jgi:hypothetical protein
MTCVRQAWLTMGDDSVQLHNEPGGYFVTSLDLGSPDVRAVISHRPDADGADDRTQYLGSRLVSVDITAVLHAGAQIDAVAASFAPYMSPRQRPVLHYVLDRPGAPERTMTVRAAAYAWKADNDERRDIQLQFVAADPAAYDPTVQQATSAAGGVVGAGRTYSLTFGRSYPAGGGSPSTGIINSGGDLPVQPFLRIFGPITQPVVTFQTADGRTMRVAFLSTFAIGAGAYVDVDPDAKTARYMGDPAQNMLARLDWSLTTWPLLPAGSDNRMTLTGGNSSGATQVLATWQDAFLT